MRDEAMSSISPCSILLFIVIGYFLGMLFVAALDCFRRWRDVGAWRLYNEEQDRRFYAGETSWGDHLGSDMDSPLWKRYWTDDKK